MIMKMIVKVTVMKVMVTVGIRMLRTMRMALVEITCGVTEGERTRERERERERESGVFGRRG